MNDVSLKGRGYKKNDTLKVKQAVEQAEWDLLGHWKCDCHEVYAAELFTVLCNTTAGVAKAYLRQLQESGCNDVYLALKLLQGKHDVYTKSNMLKEFLKVVNRSPLQPRQDLETAVEAWEAEIAKVEVRYNRTNFLSEDIHMAIFLNKLPKEYKEKVFDRMAALPWTALWI